MTTNPLPITPQPENVQLLGGQILARTILVAHVDVTFKSSMSKNSYQLAVLPTYIKIIAADNDGETRARQTLDKLQSLGDKMIPCAIIAEG